MSNVSPNYNDEIDLLNFMETVWDGKWKIVFIMVVSLLSVLGFKIIKPNLTFTATTQIKAITSFEFDKYRMFNSSLKKIEKIDKVNQEFTIFEITKKNLLDSYIELIEEGSFLETGIDKYNLINKDDFKNEQDYKEAKEKFASKIEILNPKKTKNEISSHYVLKAEYNDKVKWKDFLLFVNEEVNKKLKASISNRFATIISIQNQKKDFAIKDIDIKIDNAKKDYDRNTKDRIAFLIEQAAIARKLNVRTSHIFTTKNEFATDVNTDIPFYLRGYLAIEEEIKQISLRKNKLAFIKGLYELEQQKRDLQQDKTIERATYLFKKTPLKQSDFQASVVKVNTTDFEINNNFNLYYAIAIIFGGMLGVAYVTIDSAFRNRRNNKVSS